MDAKTLTILTATMSGTSEMVAFELEPATRGHGLKARILKAGQATPAGLAEQKLLLVCTSTYGTGEVPDEAKALVADLDAQRPSLEGLRYGVVALGDMKYPATFCGGGKTFDALLTELGATRIGAICEIDASTGVYPEEVAEEWFEDWVPALLEAAAESAG
jgi:MioC protein